MAASTPTFAATDSTELNEPSTTAAAASFTPPTPAATAPSTGLQVIRRNGQFSPFDASKISVAITKAFIAVEGTGAAGSTRIRETVDDITTHVVEALTRRADGARALHIEDIQDAVELGLMRSGEHKVARAYVLYRDARAQERRERDEAATPATPAQSTLQVKLPDGRTEPLDDARLFGLLVAACDGLDGVSPEAIMAEVRPQRVRRHKPPRARPRPDHGRPHIGRGRPQLRLRFGAPAAQQPARRGSRLRSPRSRRSHAGCSHPRLRCLLPGLHRQGNRPRDRR